MRSRSPLIAPLGGLVVLLGCSSPDFHSSPDPSPVAGGGGVGMPAAAGATSMGGNLAAAGEASVPTPVPGRVRRLTRLELQNTLADLLGGEAAELAQTIEADTSATKFSTGADRGVSANYASDLSRVAVLASSYLDQAEASALVDESCVLDDERELACVRDFTRAFSARAWRRPVSDDEVEELVVVYRAGVGTAEPEAEPLARAKLGLKYVVRAVLQAPSFLFRTELGSAGEAPQHQLTSYELAAALSYGLTAAPPDAELRELAARVAAPTAEELTAQGRRLLSAYPERYARMAEGFVREWLGIDLSSPAWRKDTALYPNATPVLKAALDRETTFFLQDWARSSSFEQLLTTRRAFVSRKTAWMYDVAEDSPLFYSGAPEFSPIEVSSGVRSGVLTLPSFLGSMAHEAASSPVLRGVAVMRRLLCHEPPPVPAMVPPLPPVDPSVAKTTRARYEQHTSVAYCAGCHDAFDAMGFAFERYDAMGAYRDQENGLPVDSSGALIDAGQVTPVPDAVALASLLAESPTVHACFVHQAYRFTSGQAESAAEAAALADVGAQFRAGGSNVADLILTLVLQQASLPRQASGEP